MNPKTTAASQLKICRMPASLRLKSTPPTPPFPQSGRKDTSPLSILPSVQSKFLKSYLLQTELNLGIITVRRNYQNIKRKMAWIRRGPPAKARPMNIIIFFYLATGRSPASRASKARNSTRPILISFSRSGK